MMEPLLQRVDVPPLRARPSTFKVRAMWESQCTCQFCRWIRSATLVLCCINTLAPLWAQEVTVYVSSKAGDRLSAKKPLRFEPASAKSSDFRIDDSVKYQTIAGFGASFLEAGLVVLNTLPPGEQEAVLRAIFDPKTGAGFSAMKTTIAGTDFMAAGPTYDESSGDVELKHFSIARGAQVCRGATLPRIRHDEFRQDRGASQSFS